MLLPDQIEFEMPDHFQVDLLQYAIGKPKLPVTSVEDSYSTGYLFGTFLGDGCSQVSAWNNSELGGVSWYFGKKEQRITNKVVQCCEDLFELDASITELKNIDVVKLNSLPISRFFQNFGKGPTKRLPEELLVGNKDYLQGLYDGLLDSDGHIGKDGRKTLDNTSMAIMELWMVLTQMLLGSVPNINIKAPGKNGVVGGLQGANPDNFATAYVSRLNVSHQTRHRDSYQIVKPLALGKESKTNIPVYDIEVDCPTHSFIANNVIVHNSICATRIVSGSGMPQISAILDCAKASRKLKIPIIADGGMKNSADLCKGIAAGASTAILGSMLAGTPESPGRVILNTEGDKYKKYRGMASMEAMLDKKVKEGFTEDEFEEKNVTAAEGIETLIKMKPPVEKVVGQLLGGLRSGMSYADSRTIPEFHKKAKFVYITDSGQAESRTHILER